MRIFNTILVASVLAMLVIAPARGDVCFDYRKALEARDTATRLYEERRSDLRASNRQELVAAGMSFAKSIIRVDEAERAVRSNVSDEKAAATIDSLFALRSAQANAWGAAVDWSSRAQNSELEPLISNISSITAAIEKAKKSAIMHVCR